jgi:hypothetical protein
VPVAGILDFHRRPPVRFDAKFEIKFDTLSLGGRLRNRR